ncbi:hypothetical protein SVIO_110760 [Streptomyces violaceusniger]|uniref:Uncharacterized protein n=1 Tax=Streptomyces violaceusniger TaxID=68280 RepID=A0A4D4LQU2_STRVO|nr:hypothetical protein SVIO_110760 [Streptomyces violaceusniger]
MQGVNIDPPYGLGQHVRAHFDLCGDGSPPSVDHLVQPGPTPLPTPAIDPGYEGSEQLRITGIANGARVSFTRNGAPVGTYRCWGGALLVSFDTPFTAGETVTATQRLCDSGPPSPPGDVTIQPCSALPAPASARSRAGT